MEIPEEFRCCICLSTPERALQTGCPHLVCMSCVVSGSLKACPVCRHELSAEHTADEAFAERMAAAVLTCECGLKVPVLEAVAHSCESLQKKRKEMADAAPPPFASSQKTPPPAANRSTFACPLCEEGVNLTTQGLLEHCERVHGRQRVSAVCPVCAAMPWGDPNYRSGDILSHLRLRHKCDYAVLADFETSEEEALKRALEASVQDAGIPALTGPAQFGFMDDEEDFLLAQALAMSAQEAESGSNDRATTSPLAGAWSPGQQREC